MGSNKQPVKTKPGRSSRGALRRVLKNLRSRRILIKYIVNFPLAPPSHSSPRKVDLPVDQKPAGLCGEKKGSLLRSEVNGDVNLPIPTPPPQKPIREIRVIREQIKNATPPPPQNPLCASVSPRLCVKKEDHHA